MDVDGVGVAITSEEFISFLDERCSESVCSGCQAEHFNIVAAEGVACLFSSPIVNIPKARTMPYYAIYCMNCGMLRHHAAIVVTDWLETKREILRIAKNEQEIRLSQR